MFGLKGHLSPCVRGDAGCCGESPPLSIPGLGSNPSFSTCWLGGLSGSLFSLETLGLKNSLRRVVRLKGANVVEHSLAPSAAGLEE